MAIENVCMYAFAFMRGHAKHWIGPLEGLLEYYVLCRYGVGRVRIIHN